MTRKGWRLGIFDGGRTLGRSKGVATHRELVNQGYKRKEKRRTFGHGWQFLGSVE